MKWIRLARLLFASSIAAVATVVPTVLGEEPAPHVSVAALSPEMARFRANLVDFYSGKGADLNDPEIAAALARFEKTATDYLDSMIVDGVDPGPIEPPTPEEIVRRRADDQAGATKKTVKTDLPKAKDPSDKPSGGSKIDGKKSRGGEIGGWRDLLPSIQGMPNSSLWSIGLRAHYDRVLLLAQAYHTPGQSLHRRPDVKQAVERGLTFAAKYVYVSMGRIGMNDPREVRVPMRLGPILLLMQADLDPDVLRRQVQLLEKILPLFEKIERSGGGANLVWGMMNHQFHALLVGDADRMNRAAKLIGSTAVAGTKDAIQPDNSYLYHDGIVTIGSYGTGQVHELARYSLFARGTSYGLSPEQFDVIVRFAWEGVVWNFYHNYAGATVVGRAITRGQKQTGGFHALLYLADTPSARQNEFTAAAKKVLETWLDDVDTYRGQISAVNGGTAFDMAALISKVKRSPVAAAWPTGHRHYPCADYTVHRRPDYFLSVKMLSERIRSGERAWGDGMKTWHLSDGFTYLARRGDEYFAHDVLPTLDWQRLPGTTVERLDRDPQSGFGFGTRKFVGGTSTGRFGVSAMDFAAIDSPLTAKKSWFFFEDEVVCLGSDVNCSSSHPVETIVEQWPLADVETPFYVDDAIRPSTSDGNDEPAKIAWAQCDGVGYYFPGGQTVRAQRGFQTGRWEEIGSRPGNGTHRNEFATLWFDHGRRPTDAQYSYAVLPNQSRESMRQYAVSPAFNIAAHSSMVHAVEHQRLNVAGIVFWQVGTWKRVAVDRPCLVFYQITDGGLTLSVSDPTQQDSTEETTLHLTFDGRLSPVDVPANMTLREVGDRTEITVKARGGFSHVAKLSIAAQ